MRASPPTPYAAIPRRQFLSRLVRAGAAGAAFAALPRFAAAAAPASEAKPNFVFILADDLGWADLHCYGNTFIDTPNLDRLATEGMRFTDAYAAAPVCSPTRASIMTGQYPARVGVYDFIPGHRLPWAKLLPQPNGLALPPENVTLAEALRDAGYVSASIGKWHLGPGPETQGFVKPPADGDDASVLPEAFAQEVADFARQNKGKNVGRLTQQAVRFIAANRSRPFLCFLSHHAVHIPCQARADLVAKYKARAGETGSKINPAYAAMTEALDDSVGLMMKALDRLGLAERTVFVFFSDNGGLDRIYTGNGPFITTNEPLRGVKGQLYEGGIRAPLIVRWPGVVPPGAVCRTPVISNDFLPTMLEIAGGRPKAGQVIDGCSLLPLLQGRGKPSRDALYWYYPTYHHSTPAVAIREGDYKLLEFFEDGRLELYDLRKDLGEQENLASRMPDKADALREKLRRWREAIGAPLPTPNPEYDPAKASLWGTRRR